MKIGIAGPIETNTLKDYLLLPDSYPKGLGGTCLNNLIIGFLALGYQVSVYSLDIEAKKDIVLKGDNLIIYYGYYRPEAWKRKLDFFFSEHERIKKFAQFDQPDIISAHWGYEFAIGAIRSGLPHLITLHDIPNKILFLNRDSYRLIRFLMNLWVMKNGKYFNANSIYTKEKLNYFRKNISVVNNSILRKTILNGVKQFPTDKIKIVSVLNGWGKIKNPIPALKAFKMLRKEYNLKVEYHLWGPGYENNGYGYNLAKDYDLIEGVNFHGFTSNSFLVQELEKYDILLHPSIEESFGMTLIEAMAKGLPVIAGINSGAVPDILRNGENGILVDISDHEIIYESLRLLITQEEIYNRLSIDGIKYVKENFTEITAAKKYIEILERILNGEKH